MHSGMGNLHNRLGFPIRRFLDHCLVTSSLRLIASSYVLHRLSTPRHPPYALNDLVMPTSSQMRIHQRARLGFAKGTQSISVFKKTHRRSNDITIIFRSLSKILNFYIIKIRWMQTRSYSGDGIRMVFALLLQSWTCQRACRLKAYIAAIKKRRAGECT